MTTEHKTNAYDQLYTAIEQGTILPGGRLLETELAQRLNVSRTPIREAIRRLEADGIVEHKPRVGAVVRSLSQQEIVELYEMRIVLEATAARMATQHISDAEMDTLVTLNTQIENCSGDDIQVARLNRRFHQCIVNASRNRFLAHSYRGLSNALILLGKTTLESDQRVHTVAQQHSAIIQAMQSGQGEDAARAMSDHMHTSLKHRLQSLPLDG